MVFRLGITQAESASSKILSKNMRDAIRRTPNLHLVGQLRGERHRPQKNTRNNKDGNSGSRNKVDYRISMFHHPNHYGRTTERLQGVLIAISIPSRPTTKSFVSNTL